MNKTSQTAFNFILFFLLFLLATSLQSSLFFWIIRGRATVQVALVILTYICLYRGTYEALLFSFLASYAFSLSTTIPQPVSVFAGLSICFFNQTIKKQMYSSGHVHFTRVALGNIFFYHLIGYILTMIFDNSPHQFRPLDWLLEVLLTSLFVRALYKFFIFIDQKTKRVEVSELR